MTFKPEPIPLSDTYRNELLNRLEPRMAKIFKNSLVLVQTDNPSQSLQKVCIRNVMQKLNVKGRSQAVVELVRLGELKI
ncbi:hypothetical protein ACH33_03895 [Aneurinibacillus sp. XH2]|nr:hypothetical protein ACH33_03895 [Aneurinibacillus sp. XH2]